jgi:hypothetical protein
MDFYSLHFRIWWAFSAPQNQGFHLRTIAFCHQFNPAIG